MIERGFFRLAAVLVLAACPISWAQVKVVSERIESGTAAFKFERVPSPSKTDAGNKARFSIVAGGLDANGADLEAINDGWLPRGDDQPGANLFFNAGTDGGRILADLGEATEVRRVNTYSWHRATRGPQVYKLYASDGTPAGFDAKPARGVDPEKAGWKLIATVDTQPKEGQPGGQYGVSIADESAAPLGKYRYLLFDISRTADARFGNTFFSEFDIDDGKEHAVPAVASGYQIRIDYSEMPELKDWVETKLQPTLDKWYPQIVEMLPSDGFTAPQRFTVTFKKDMEGVAYTAGTRVVCAGPWFTRNLDGEAVGAVVHELVHVAQQYRSRSNPGWLVEGVADYIRWFKYEPEAKRPRPNPARAKYTDSYRTTAAFLHHLMEKQDKEIVKKFNTAMRQGRYSPDLWKEFTGKTVDELWAEYIQTLRTR